MQQITIRGLEPEVERQIRRIARENRTSINQVVREILHDQFEKNRAPAASLRDLAGGWTPEDAEEFCTSIQSCEQIDEEMWK